MDPFHLFQTDSVTKSAEGFLRESKPWQIVERKPDVVLIGNSRNFYATDVSQMTATHAYNFSLRGANIGALSVAFEHARYHAKPRRVLLAVDSICDAPANGNMDFFSSNTQQEIEAHFKRWTYLSSFSTLKKSIKLIVDSTSKSQLLYNELGQRTEYPYSQYGKLLSQRVDKKESEKIKRLPSIPRSNNGQGCRTTVLEKILLNAYESNIELILFFNPLHLRYVEIDYLSKGVILNEKVKRKAVELVHQVASDLGKEPFTIWDFLIVNEITAELFGSPDAAEAQYWWEPSHHKPVVSDRMLAVMSSVNKDTSIGVSIDLNNFEAHALEQRQSYLNWRTQYPSSSLEIAAKLAEAGAFFHRHKEPIAK